MESDTANTLRIRQACLPDLALLRYQTLQVMCLPTLFQLALRAILIFLTVSIAIKSKEGLLYMCETCMKKDFMLKICLRQV